MAWYGKRVFTRRRERVLHSLQLQLRDKELQQQQLTQYLLSYLLLSVFRHPLTLSL